MLCSLIKCMWCGDWCVMFNVDFVGVVQGCVVCDEIWINIIIFELYQVFYYMGFVYLVEVWQDDVLIGGIYGVVLGGVYFGESMFFCDIDVLKMVLVWLIDKLCSDGFQLFDIQFLMLYFVLFGVIEVLCVDYCS